MAVPQLKEYLKSVSGLTEDYTEWTIPNGETWEIGEWWGSANPQTDCYVAIIWDYGGADDLIALTHSEQRRRIDQQFTGDGSKKLAVVLKNFTLSAEALAGGFDYKVIE